MAQLELDKEIGRERREDAEKDDDDDPRHHSNDCQARGQRQHTIADDFGNHSVKTSELYQVMITLFTSLHHCDKLP